MRDARRAGGVATGEPVTHAVAGDGEGEGRLGGWRGRRGLRELERGGDGSEMTAWPGFVRSSPLRSADLHSPGTGKHIRRLRFRTDDIPTPRSALRSALVRRVTGAGTPSGGEELRVCWLDTLSSLQRLARARPARVVGVRFARARLALAHGRAWSCIRARADECETTVKQVRPAASGRSSYGQ